jgi:hypothetical protein
MRDSSRLARRALGGLLLGLVIIPCYGVLNTSRTGLAGNLVTAQYELYTEFMWAGLLLVLPFALLGGVLGSRIPALSLSSDRLGALRNDAAWTLLLAALAFALTLAFSHLVLSGKPNQIDAFAQALHARYWAEGRLAGPTDDLGGFWAIQNSLFTERGWVSQYPPGHVALLALGFALGVPSVAGPLLAGVTVVFATLLARRLFPDDAWIARLGPLLLAVSPFFIALSGSFMNHVTAAAFTTIGAYALLRAWQDNPAWAYAAGAAFAYAFATRPLTTLATGLALAATLPLLAAGPVTVRRFLALHTRALVGAAPLITLLLTYNRYFFGSPLRMGYDLAMGPDMALGFGRDPWGNTYGFMEALGYTSGDLLALSINLLETPIPAVPVIALFLMLAPRIEPAVRVLIAWALTPVLANALYWHHGLFMGPRMLHEAAPAWALLLAAAAIGLVRMVPAGWRFDVRAAVTVALVGALCFGIGYMAPQRLASYGVGWFDIVRTPVPQLAEPGLVFVHDAWTGRVGTSLSSAGLRLDQIETLLRQNSTCDVHQVATRYTDGRSAEAATLLGRLDTVPRPDRLPPEVEIAPGDRIRVRAGERLAPDCVRHVRSDRFGILDVTPLLWQGDLPDGRIRGALFARDHGPARNAELMSRYPDRIPWLYAVVDSTGEARLLPYDEGTDLLWGDAP